MDTLLFKQEKVRKFFDILSNLGRTNEKRYKGYYPNNPDSTPCEKEVFVNRTINKWFSGKEIIWYRKSEQTGNFYKCYISINHIRFYLGYGDDLSVMYYDYSRPMDFWNDIKLSHNDIINLEGEICESSDEHNKILKLTYLNIPEKEFIFKAYDWSKYPKRKKKAWANEDIYKQMEIKISFKAKTRQEAYESVKNYENKKIIIDELIEII